MPEPQPSATVSPESSPAPDGEPVAEPEVEVEVAAADPGIGDEPSRDESRTEADEGFFDDHLLGDAAELPPAEEADPAAIAARRRRAKRYVLVSAGAAVLVLAGIFGPLGYQYVSQRNARLATPDHLAGLTLDKESGAQATADYLRTAVAASVSLDNSVGAVYANPADVGHSVLFFGGTGSLASPGQDLTTVFKLLDDQGTAMKDVHSVPAGHFGGEMRCWVSTGEGGDMTVCGWADHGSIAMALFPGRTLDEGAALLVQMRDGMQHR
jgi:hypothetical protein